MDNSLVTKIIKRFLDGDCSDEEFAYLLYWYESFDENPDIQLDEHDKEQLGKKILDRIRQRTPELREGAGISRTGSASVFRLKRRVWLKYGAVAAILVALIWGVYTRITPPSPAALTSSEDDLITLTNRSDRIHRLMLPDSSKVWLSPRSKLEYPETFRGHGRQVRLEGEAFFEIYKDPSHPFVVMSGGLVTKVLGTSFLLKAYLNDPVEVTVMTGKIEVFQRDKEEEKITLTQNDRVVLQSNGKLVKLKAMGDEEKLLWNKVNLSFDNVPLYEVVKDLNRKFRVHIYCRDTIVDHYKLNADFNNQNLADILELLEKSLNIHYEIEDDSIIYISKPAERLEGYQR